MVLELQLARFYVSHIVCLPLPYHLLRKNPSIVPIRSFSLHTQTITPINNLLLHLTKKMAAIAPNITAACRTVITTLTLITTSTIVAARARVYVRETVTAVWNTHIGSSNGQWRCREQWLRWAILAIAWSIWILVLSIFVHFGLTQQEVA